MAENVADVKEIESCFKTNPPAMSEETSVEEEPGMNVGTVEDVIPELNEVPKPQGVNGRRHSTGAIGSRASKPQVQSRYRGDHHVSSTHDFCKRGKRCDKDDAVKPLKMVKAESSSLNRKSLGSVSRQIPVTKPESSMAAKRDALAVKKKPFSSVNSVSSRVKEDNEMARSVDGSSLARKNRETQNTMNGLVKKVPGLRNKSSNYAMEKVSRINNGESSKVSAPKNLKNKDKEKIQTISSEDVKEKTVSVVESSSDSTDLESNQKPEKKIRPKKTGVKVTAAKQLSFKRGKVLEPKPEDSSPTLIKFKKNLQENRLDAETKLDSSEDSQREKIVLRHQEVDGDKKMVTLFNNVIEETMSKLKAKKDKVKVKVLISAFETVISLQTSQKVQSKTTTSASQVSPFVSEQ